VHRYLPRVDGNPWRLSPDGARPAAPDQTESGRRDFVSGPPFASTVGQQRQGGRKPAAGTTPWHHEHVATLSQAGGAFFPPSMAAAGGHVVITDSDGSHFPGGNLDYWWKRVGTTDWHQQQVAAG
jgi:hypothetical protein